MVAVADSGAATAMTISPMRMASSHSGRFIWPSKAVICLGSPVAAKALAPAKANTTVIPTTPNRGAEDCSSSHHARPLRGNCLRPSNAPVMISTTGIQTMTLAVFVMSPPVQSDKAEAIAPEVMMRGTATTTNRSRVAQPRPNAVPTARRWALSSGVIPLLRTSNHVTIKRCRKHHRPPTSSGRTRSLTLSSGPTVADPTSTNMEALNGKVMPMPALPATRVAAEGLSSLDFSIQGMVTEPTVAAMAAWLWTTPPRPAEATVETQAGPPFTPPINEFRRSISLSSTPVLSRRYPMKTKAIVAYTISSVIAEDNDAQPTSTAAAPVKGSTTRKPIIIASPTLRFNSVVQSRITAR
ncbi:hypothetical protein PJL18_04259 [Paenarthrobacter nicotinovorans]|nr:hypothetical protein [Paenarthrobacter nicotinovorans]